MALAQEARILQIWPLRRAGTISGRLAEASGVPPEALFFGIASSESGGPMRGRTYMYFPTDVFPPGTEIVEATLYVFVDSGSGSGVASAGVYRVLSTWSTVQPTDGGQDWPSLLSSPVDVTTLDLRATGPTSTPSPVDGSPTAEPTATVWPTPVATQTPSSPLATATPSESPLPTPVPTVTPSSSEEGDAELMLGTAVGSWVEWDVTALMTAWLNGDVPNYGLAIAAAPRPDAGVDEAGDLIAARWTRVQDSTTRPYIIAQIRVHPVTPTPPAFASPLMPPAGHSSAVVGWTSAGILLVGMALVAFGLILVRRM